MDETEKKYYIYELIDPRDDLPFYVGLSTWPKLRFKEHLKDRSKSPKVERIVELADVGLKPKLHIIEYAAVRIFAENRERHWISHYTQRGIVLTNIANNANAPCARKLESTEQKLVRRGKTMADFWRWKDEQEATKKKEILVPYGPYLPSSTNM